MAEIKEVLDDFLPKGKGKKIDKKKIFMIVGVGTGLIALVLWYRDKGKGSTEYVSTATGYSGYPQAPETDSLSGGGGVGGYTTDEVESLLKDNDSYWQSVNESLQSDFDSQLQILNEEKSGILSDYQNAMDENAYNSIIAQMKENSDLYLTTNDINKRRELAKENETLGAKIGATKNSAGEWYVDGSRLYETPLQASAQNLSRSNVTVEDKTDYMAVTKRLIGSGKAGNSAEVSDATIKRASKIASSNDSNIKQYATSYDKNVDYQAAINKAKADGADQKTIDTLTAQRAAKIKGENLNPDGSKK